MSGGRAEQRGASRDSNFNLSLTWPSSIAKSDLLHDGCSGSPRLAETTSGRNLGVFVSSEQPSPPEPLRWWIFLSPLTQSVPLPSSHIHRSAFYLFFYLFCHPFTLLWTQGLLHPEENPWSLSCWKLAAHPLLPYPTQWPDVEKEEKKRRKESMTR